MKNRNDGIIYARVPKELLRALERERKRMSKETGVKWKKSAVIRFHLERSLLRKEGLGG